MEIKLVKSVPIDKIKPDPEQPRKTFDRDEIGFLKKSIEAGFQISQILVDESYQIIVGERRWRALKALGFKELKEGEHFKIIKGLSELEKRRIQSDEDILHKPIDIAERDKFWYKIYNEHKFKTKRELADFLHVSEKVINDAFDRLEFQKLTDRKFEGSPYMITETAGLPTNERIQLLKTAEKKDIGSRKIRDYVQTIKISPEPVKRELIKGNITPEVAQKIISIPKEDLQEKALKEAVKLSGRGTLSNEGILQRVQKVVEGKMDMPQESFDLKVFNKVMWNLERIEHKDFYTLGFGSWEINHFIRMLKKVKVKTLVDVRDTPFSQYKPEFNKNSLSKTLEESGIGYMHVQKLGVPVEVRQRLAKEVDYNWFFNWYDKNVLSNGIVDKDFTHEKMKFPIAIMCTEFDPTKCHRHRISLALERKGLKGYDL